MIYRAAHVLDAELRIRTDWAVRVAGRNIVETGPATGFRGEGGIDLGDVLLMPGWVNAHTHLELGFLRGSVPPSADFADWLRRLLARLRAVPGEIPEVDACVRAGLDASRRAGTTLLGDITRNPVQTRRVIASVGDRPAALSFGEVIAVGGLRDRLEQRITAALAAGHAADDLAVGVSPHAPYTVEPDAIRACVQQAQARGLRVCIHAAESEQEVLFTCAGRGPLRDFLTELGLWDQRVPVAGCRPVELLDRCAALGPGTLLAHCNYVTDAEIERLAESRTSVVYCPRTHAAFGHAPHRFVEMLARGVNVCLGTDSLASNPSLSVGEEVAYLGRAHPGLDPAMLVRMGTVNGAIALGLGETAGVVTPGRRADLIALGPAPARSRLDLEYVISADVRVQAVIRGEELYRVGAERQAAD